MEARYDSKSQTATLNEGKFGGKRMSNGKKCAIGTAVVVVLAALVGLIVYFAAFHNKQADGVSTPSAATTTAAAGDTATTTLEVTTSPPSVPENSPPAGRRYDCQPDLLTKDRSECERRGCIWDYYAQTDDNRCFRLFDNATGLFVQSGSGGPTPYSQQLRQTLRLRYAGERRPIFSPPADVIENITVQIDEYPDMFRIKFTDADDPDRYQVPLQLNLPPPAASSQAEMIVGTSGEKFYVKILRKSDNTTIFDTSVSDIIFEKQYLSLSTLSPTRNVYGFGENLHKTFRHQFNKTEVWPAFARDQPPGQNPAMRYENLYGVHPFYVCIEDSGKAHGVFMLNSNAQDYTLTTSGMITFRTIGGILDFFVFTGPTPENVIQHYTRVIGRPYLPPYWALGFQICRYGYKNITEVEMVVKRTRDAQIPHDVQYVDIDYMDGRKDFTIDPENFGGLPEYFSKLRSEYNMSTIIILDPAISIENGYNIYPEGKDADIYIKWPTGLPGYTICDGCADDENNMLGYVWPDNKTVFPDFFKTSTAEMWKQWILNQSRELEFDGLWIDMNEPASFDTNNDKPWNWDAQRPGEPAWNLKCDMNNSYENPPYKTKACHLYEGLFNISDKTICMVGVQGENNSYMHYDVHNLYGWSQSKPSLDAMREVTGKRSMVISRSTFPGSGQWVGHWLGDNSAYWQHLRDSIVGMLEFNLFGIPYVGADICGFFEDSNAQLCKRWMQLGAFYPFSRNHNGINWLSHDPASFDDPTVAQLSRSSLETRYRLLPYLYTLFYHANTEGSTVVRSLQFEWPTDPHALDISEQFLWGNALLFSPILYENATSMTYYLPSAVWYDFYSNEKVSNGSETREMEVNSTTEIPIHVRGGSILPMKESRLTTPESRLTPFTLLVALDDSAEARGTLYWDDGFSVSPKDYCFVEFTVANQTLSSEHKSANCTADSMDADGTSITIGTIIILGVAQPPQNVTLAGNTIDSSSYVYNEPTQLLTVNTTAFSQTINTPLRLEW